MSDASLVYSSEQDPVAWRDYTQIGYARMGPDDPGTMLLLCTRPNCGIVVADRYAHDDFHRTVTTLDLSSDVTGYRMAGGEYVPAPWALVGGEDG